MTRAVIVDDDDASARLAQRILTDLGLEEVLRAPDAPAFDRLAAGHPFDLVLLDIRLGWGESGLELAERAVNEHGPAVVMVSAVDDPVVFRKAVALGAHGYVVKPYRTSELQISALNALRRRDLERQASRHQDELTTVVEQRTAELQATLTELQRIVRVREEMLANCSHELRTPLTPILGWAKYLVRRPDVEPEQVRSCAAVITEQANRLLSVIEALLAASAISGSRGAAVVPSPCCDAATVARSLVAEHDGRVSLDAPPGEVLVPLGEQGLRVVLTQLVDNALRFGADSPVSLAVVDDDPAVVRLVLTDHGPGLPADREQTELLESFVQGDGSSTREVGGLGIGLYLVAGLVDAHGGAVSLDETPGGGLTVTVRLPRSVRPHDRSD